MKKSKHDSSSQICSTFNAFLVSVGIFRKTNSEKNKSDKLSWNSSGKVFKITLKEEWKLGIEFFSFLYFMKAFVLFKIFYDKIVF